MKHKNVQKLPVRKQVYRECAKIMTVPVLLQTIVEIMAGVLGVLTANTLGSFAEAAFQMELSIGVQAALRLLACILATVVLSPAVEMLGSYLMFKQSLRHDLTVFQRYLQKEAERAGELDNGEVQYELEDAPCQLRIQWVVLLSKGISLPICLGYLLFCAGSISWTMTVMLLAVTAIQLLTPLIMQSALGDCDREEKAYRAARRSCETDIVASPHTVKLWSLQQALLERLRTMFADYHQKNGRRYIRFQVCNQQLRSFTQQFTQIAFFLVGALLVAKGKVTAGQLTAMLTYLTVAHSLLSNVGDLIENYPLLTNAAERVCWIYQDPERTKGASATENPDITGQDISFSYQEKEVLHKVCFSIRAGDKVCIVGENGSGKTTLCKLMLALRDGYTGSLRVGGQELRELAPESIRHRLVYAEQSPHLFRATALENILLGDESIHREAAEKLMESLGILHLINRQVDDESDLSGGCVDSG